MFNYNYILYIFYTYVLCTISLVEFEVREIRFGLQRAYSHCHATRSINALRAYIRARLETDLKPSPDKCKA